MSGSRHSHVQKSRSATRISRVEAASDNFKRSVPFIRRIRHPAHLEFQLGAVNGSVFQLPSYRPTRILRTVDGYSERLSLVIARASPFASRQKLVVELLGSSSPSRLCL